MALANKYKDVNAYGPSDLRVGTHRHNRAGYLMLTVSLLLFSGCLPAKRTTSSGSDSDSKNTNSEDSVRFEAALEESSGDLAQKRVLLEAEVWLGVPYKYGGNGPDVFDCSGYTKQVFKSVEIELPRTSADQSQIGSRIGLEEIEAADLLFFNTSGSGVSHVGIAINSKEFIHASTSKGVTVSSIDENYYRTRFMFARRILKR